MKEPCPIDRTYHPKHVNYFGDGNGRDHYVTFNNGGLHGLRDYRGSVKNSFNLGPNASHQGVTPMKEPTAFDYKPDGTGRDLYVIRLHGLKRNYKSNFRDFEHGLRAEEQTPMMDSMQIFKREPTDATMYNHWPSQTAVREQIKTAQGQRSSIQKLCESPNRTSPMRKFQDGAATFNKNPMLKTNNFLQARESQSRQSAQKQSADFVTPMKLRKIHDRESGTRDTDAKHQVNEADDDLQNYLDIPMANLVSNGTVRGNTEAKQSRTKNLTPAHNHTQNFSFVESSTGQSAVFRTLAKRYRANQKRGMTPQLISSHMNRSPIGHDTRLDNVSPNKVVNNDPKVFFVNRRNKNESKDIQIEV